MDNQEDISMILRPLKKYMILNYLYVIVTLYGAIALIIGIWLPEIFTFVLILMIIAVIIIIISLLIIPPNVKYIITNNSLCIRLKNGNSYSYPMNELIIVNEKRIRHKKPKAGNIIIKAKVVNIRKKPSILNLNLANVLANFLDNKVKKRVLYGIKNPESVCDLLNQLSDISKAKTNLNED